MKKSDIFGFMLLTLGLGIVTGILIAPKSGKETRKDLSEKFEKGFEEACDFLTYESGRIKSKVNDTVDYFKSKLNDESQ
jgi:gas vesicle protein